MTVETKPVLSAFADAIVSSLSIPEASVAALLKFIDCHPELRGLAAVAENLISILDLLGQIVPNETELSKAMIQEWITICRYIKDEAGSLNSSFPEINIQAKNQNNPFSKVYEKYPLYVSLWFQHPEPAMQRRHRLLQAHLLLTQFHFRKLTEDEGRKYDSTTAESTRLIRQFADTSKLATVLALQPLLEKLPSEPKTMEAFLDDIHVLESDEQLSSRAIEKSLDVLRRMLWYAEEHRGGFSRRNSRAWEAILKREAIRMPIISSDPETHAHDFTIETILMPSQTEVVEKLARQAGCAPGEVKAGVEHFIYSEDLYDGEQRHTSMAGRSPLAHVRRTREKHNAVAMSNQLLPTQWGRLTLQELTLFLRSVSNLTRDKKAHISFSYGKISNQELAAMLTAMYWTGNDLATVHQYRFCKTRNDLPQVESLDPNDFRFVFDSEEWVHGSLRPDYKSLLKEPAKQFLNDTYNYVILPIQNGTAGILRRCLATRVDKTQKKWRSKRIFEQNLADYDVAVTAFLRSINRKYKIRLTKTRIANDLFQRLCQYGGDIVEPMLITGRGHYLGMVPLHYSSPSLYRLQTVYTGTCQLISDAVYQSLEKPAKPAKVNKDQFPETEAIQKYAGGRHYLIKGMVTKLLDGEQGLVQRFNECLKFAGFNDYWVNLHNDYTLYVVEMLGFATGYRAVRDPLDSLAQIDWLTGFACISDKDDLDYYNARLVWIPSLVRDQIRNYQQHCRQLGERLMLINPRLAKKLLNHGDPSDGAVPFLFLLKPDGRLLKLRPTEIYKRLRDIFPVPVNANRSYLRNRLRELDCPGEMVNYFLGHWENGEEPFGPYSTLSPQAYKQALEPLLEQIMKADGWRIIQGFGRT
jgi:hypothetical protein